MCDHRGLWFSFKNVGQLRMVTFKCMTYLSGKGNIMQFGHKQRIRSLINTIPSLIRASLISQAFEAERVIASTFEFSEAFRVFIRNVPPHYIEITKKSYSDLMFKAFEGGNNLAKTNSGLLAGKAGEELLDIIKTKLPMPGILAQDLVAAFDSAVGDLYKTVVNNEEMGAQFKRDLECAFAEGAAQFASTLPKETPADKIEKVEEVIKEAEQAKQEVALPAPTGPEPEAPSPTEEDLKEAAPVTAETKDSLTLKLEEYTKLLSDPRAEEILRYTLGLPPRTVTASSVKDVALAKLIGPYDTDALTAKTLSLAKSHDMSDDELQTIVVDCIISGVDSYKSGDELAKVIAAKLGMEALAQLETLSMGEVDAAADIMSEALTSSTGLPGDFYFMEQDNDYCLIFAYDREEAAKLASAGETLVFASLPGSPQGALKVSDQEEIKSLLSIGKLSSFKKVKAASPKVYALMSEALIQMRNSKVDIAEGCKMLKRSMAEYVEDAFGKDGADYYEFLKKEA